MPELGKYEKLPRPDSIEKFLQYLSANPIISEIQRLDKQVFYIHRKEKRDLKIYLTNVYIVGIADVIEILSLVSDIQAVVTMSAWNSYTNEAKMYCRRQQIGLFKFKEFLGAVYFDGNRFFDYIPQDDRQ
jgi:hypothetical protein